MCMHDQFIIPLGSVSSYIVGLPCWLEGWDVLDGLRPRAPMQPLLPPHPKYWHLYSSPGRRLPGENFFRGPGSQASCQNQAAGSCLLGTVHGHQTQGIQDVA